MKYNDTLFYKIVKPILKFIFVGLFRPTVVGLENLPKEGRILIAGNHTKWWDSIMLISMTNRPVHFLAKKELFDSWKTNWIMKLMGCIPVNRKAKDHNALEMAYRYLENERCIAIFPEGTINRTDDIIMPFKMGAVKACNTTNTKLVPFIITGKYEMFKKSIKLEFLKPMKIGNDLEKENQKLMDIVSKKLVEGGKTHGNRKNDRV